MQSLVSLSAFPKSGVTYLSFLLFYSLFPDSCDIHEIEQKYILDIFASSNPRFADPNGPRIFKSHIPYIHDHPIVRATGKAVYLIRHPIDVMMSLWDYQYLIDGGARDMASPRFRAFVREWVETGGTASADFGPWTTHFRIFGTWVNHVRSWLNQSRIPVHLVTYRDLVQNPMRELPAILDFIGAAVPAERQQFAIEKSSMKAMAELEEQEVAKKKEGVFFNKDLAANYGQGHRFVNKGYRDSYAGVLTPEERAIADKTFGPEIARFFGAPA